MYALSSVSGYSWLRWYLSRKKEKGYIRIRRDDSVMDTYRITCNSSNMDRMTDEDEMIVPLSLSLLAYLNVKGKVI